MMVERHYDDEALISLMETGRVASDAHLPSCKACSEKLQSFRGLSDVLHDASVWDRRPLSEEPVRSTIATLRAFADRMTDEDTRADAYLRDLLAGSREEWMSRLQQHPEYRTAGVVRKLIVASDRAIDTMPPDAVEITRLATEIADHLEPVRYPSDTVSRLRGAAWRDRAYALFYTGDYIAAERAISLSERHFSDCVVEEYELARVGIVKALIGRPLERFQDALDASARAGQIFAAFGDETRRNSSRSVQAGIHAGIGAHHEALRIWQEIDSSFANDDLSDSRARIIANIAHSYRELGDLSRATAETTIALELFEALGARSEVARLAWNLGRLLQSGERLDEALARFLESSREFDRLGMSSEAVLASLDAAELLLVQGDVVRVEQICSVAVKRLQEAGLGEGARMLTAISFLHEAAVLRRATVELVSSVRQYVRQLPEEPNLLFAPPPPPPD